MPYGLSLSFIVALGDFDLDGGQQLEQGEFQRSCLEERKTEAISNYSAGMPIACSGLPAGRPVLAAISALAIWPAALR